MTTEPGLHGSPDLTLPLDAVSTGVYPVTGTLAMVSALTAPLHHDGMVFDHLDLVRALDRLANRTIFGECWLWSGYSKNGYPSLSIHNRDVYAHRLMLALKIGRSFGSLDACHQCDTRCCWRPLHLFVGTQAENVRDAYDKGRAVPPPRITGIEHHLTTLSEATLYAIASDHGTQRGVAQRFGVSQSTVWRARHGLARR